MFLSNFSIKQPVTTVAIIIVLMCLGLLALKNLRVNQIPDVEQPVMVVNFPYPGASPETVEREIINRVEKSLQSIPQVYEMRSTASEGNAQFVIIFDFKKNMAEAADEIRNAIAAVRYKLPIEMREPVLFRVDPAAEPIMKLALSSTKQSHAEISRLAEDVLADQLRGRRRRGRGQRQRRAAPRAVGAAARAEAARVQRVGGRSGERAARAEHQRAGGPRARASSTSRASGSSGRIESPSEFNDIVVKRQGNEVVRLGQVATVEDGFAEPGSYSLRNGQPNVGLSVIRSREASTVSVAERVRARSRGDQQDAARGHEARGHARRRRRGRRHTSTT